MVGNKHSKVKLAIVSMVLIAAILACSINLTNPTPDTTYITETVSALATEMAAGGIASAAPPENGETSARPPVAHSVTPPEPIGLAKWITDKSDISVASQHRANGGENFDKNLFERPFTSGVMDYLPDLDINEAYFSRTGDWVFVELIMSGQNPAGGMRGVYGIEVDSNMNGRGDFIIYCSTPTSSEWTSTGVKAYEDTNQDVGGMAVLTSDTHPGNGYDTLIFDEGYTGDPDAAWCRLSPTNSSGVQLAFKYTLIRNNDKYMWGGWTGLPEMVDPTWFDYNDHFTHAIAGSPLTELTNYYPLKEFYGWDNTCRWVVGILEPKGTEPGLCPYTPIVPAPTVEPTLTKIPGPNSINP
jgi:hypothetical protein